MSALKVVQIAVYNKLIGDATLMGMVTGVFDDPPEKTKFPYITIGEATETPFNTFGRKGREVSFVVHIWSQYSGYKEVLEILERVNAILDDQPLTVSGFANTVYVSFEHALTLLDFDRKTRHVPARFRVVLQK